LISKGIAKHTFQSELCKPSILPGSDGLGFAVFVPFAPPVSPRKGFAVSVPREEREVMALRPPIILITGVSLEYAVLVALQARLL
jgi:hypothetical protein